MRSRPRRTLQAESDALTEYLDDIGRYRLLSREEEKALGRRIRLGDATAVNALVCANLRFVVTVAKQYQRRGVALLDLIDEGNLGLIRAAERFDETKGIKFISYAVWWIRQAMLHALTVQSRIVHVPARRAAAVHRVGRQANALLQKLGREPSRQELAAELDVSEEDIASALVMARAPLSLDAPTAGEDSPFLEYVPDEASASPEEATFEKARAAAITDALATLRPRDARIVRMHFGFDSDEPMTLEEIGARLGITRERVRQIRDRALRTLRKTVPHLALAG